MTNWKEKARKDKEENILGLAVSASAMMRVFEKGSGEEMTKKLGSCINKFLECKNQEEFDRKHEEFCEWATENIKTAERKRKGKIIKESVPISWGQAAKTIDVTLKVYFYYCRLPFLETSQKIIHLLHGAIDTALLKHLKRNYPSQMLSQIYSLEDINKEKYIELQKMIEMDIKESFDGKLYPVEYDDIMWRKLNKQKMTGRDAY